MTAVLIAVAAALASSYGGATDEGRRITIALDADRAAVTRVVTTVVAYDCARFGDVGPLRIVATPPTPARVDRRGRFAFVTGNRAERIGVAGRIRAGGLMTGRVRVSGTIATGERCTSNAVRFRAARATR